MVHIESKHNDRVKNLRRLNKRRYREESNTLLVEGVRLLQEALSHGFLTEVWYCPELIAENCSLVEEVETAGIPIFSTTSSVFKEISNTINPQGVLGVAKQPRWKDITQGQFEDTVLVVADRIQDPGNLGTLFRTAAASGAAGIVLVKGAVDPYNPKVVRASAGAVFKIPHYQLMTDDCLQFCRQHAIKIVVAALTNARDYYDVNIGKNVAIVIGNEGQGVDPAFLQVADYRVRIPLDNQVESLNASVAAGILLYESRRQRAFREL